MSGIKNLFVLLSLLCASLRAPPGPAADAVGDDDPVLLKHIAVEAEVLGRVAEVEVTQVFENTLTQPMEAVYVFPLPEDAAVHDMVMQIGERTIRSQIEERAAAAARYQAARAEGQVAALLEQERPNIFTQSIANLPPGERIEVTVTYTRALEYRDGRYRFHHPVAVGPRFVPEPDCDSDSGIEVADADRIQPLTWPEGQPVPYTLDVSLHINAGMPVRDLRSPSHDLRDAVTAGRGEALRVALERERPDQDVEIGYALTSGEPEMGLLVHRDGTGTGYFDLLLEPPPLTEGVESAPRELVFLLDTSCSMSGIPMEASKELMHRALDGLREGDHFRILRFSDEVSALSAAPLGIEALDEGHRYIRRLMTGGGTHMERGISAALSAPPDGDRMRIVVLLTDGYIGHESDIFALVRRELGAARIFGLGVGSATNRFLLENLAESGRGETHYLVPGEDPAPTIEAFYRRIDAPVLSDIEIDWGRVSVSDLSHAPIPDLFAGAPLSLSGRIDRLPRGSHEITVRARRGGEPIRFTASLSGAADSGPQIARIWARDQITRIERGVDHREDLSARERILPLALEYGLMSRYTSLVAVDESRIIPGPAGQQEIPLPLPRGVTERALSRRHRRGLAEPIIIPELSVEEVIEPEEAWGESELARVVEERIFIRDPLQFAFNTDHLLPESIPTLDYVARLLNGNDRIGHVVIEGHASEEGSFAHNYALSIARARAVWEALICAGVHPDRISYRGYGEVRPRDIGSLGAGLLTEAELADNRRVELKIVHQYGPLEVVPERAPIPPLPWGGSADGSRRGCAALQ